jgi:hypothetical protein
MSSSKRPIEEEDKAIMVDEDEICTTTFWSLGNSFLTNISKPRP